MIPRKYPRFAVHIPISFTGDHEGEGLVTNLSVGGCRVEHTDAVVDVKAMLTVLLPLSINEPPIKVDAALVRWTSSPNFGLEFVFLRPEALQRLERYLNQLPPDAQVAP
jgi:hypothetical protein